MTRKDYALIARALGKARRRVSPMLLYRFDEDTVEVLIAELIDDNPNFNPAKFRDMIMAAQEMLA